jgi:hypothetical protein
MRLQPLYGRHLLNRILSAFFVAGLFTALFVTAEGVLPLRQRHRPRALIAARQHYKRAFSNDTTDGTDTTSQDSASPTTTGRDGGGLVGSVFNDTVDNANAIVGAPLFQPASNCILLTCFADCLDPAQTSDSAPQYTATNGGGPAAEDSGQTFPTPTPDPFASAVSNNFNTPTPYPFASVGSNNLDTPTPNPYASVGSNNFDSPFNTAGDYTSTLSTGSPPTPTYPPQDIPAYSPTDFQDFSPTNLPNYFSNTAPDVQTTPTPAYNFDNFPASNFDNVPTHFVNYPESTPGYYPPAPTFQSPPIDPTYPTPPPPIDSTYPTQPPPIDSIYPTQPPPIDSTYPTQPPPFSTPDQVYSEPNQPISKPTQLPTDYPPPTNQTGTPLNFISGSPTLSGGQDTLPTNTGLSYDTNTGLQGPSTSGNGYNFIQPTGVLNDTNSQINIAPSSPPNAPPTPINYQNGTDVKPTTSVAPKVVTTPTWLPTGLMTQPALTTPAPALETAPNTTSSLAATATPSIPKVIIPTDGIPSEPENSTLVRIGFLEALNYPFVVQHSVTVAQIFQTLPLAGGSALKLPTSEFITQSLQPYAMAHYTATVAMLWIPTDQVETLQVQLLSYNSPLYSQTDATAQQLVDLIDDTIPLLADGGTPASAGGATGSSNQPLSTNPVTGAGSGSLDNSGSGGSGSTSSTGKQVAIGVGAAAAAIGYAALMFFGAKRFRRKSTEAQLDRRHHSRVSSITGERAPSPFYQSYRSSRGSSGRAIKGQNISAPLMTENSLLL